MTPDDIIISGGRYWAPKLHGSHQPRKLKHLGEQDRGTYTATVDGQQGIITIAADGWYFTHLPERVAHTPIAPAMQIPSLQNQLEAARALLAEWLQIDDWEDDLIAPLMLVERTRAFVGALAEVSPAQVALDLAAATSEVAHAP